MAGLFLAMTTSETNNLVTAILAKKMGAKMTVARINNEEYLSENARATFEELGVDKLMCPGDLAAYEIERLIERCSLTDIFDFEEGKMSLIGITLDDSSPLVNKTLAEIDNSNEDFYFDPSPY